MACSICSQGGHDARSCPQNPDNSVRDRAMIIRVDNLTKKEEQKLIQRVITVKDKVAPDSRGTIVKGTQNQLPSQPIKELKPGED